MLFNGIKGHKKVDCCKKKQEVESGNVCEESEKSTEIMLCGFVEDLEIQDQDLMYALVDSLCTKITANQKTSFSN